MTLSPDGRLLYFMGAHPVDANRARRDLNLWVSRRVDRAWSVARPLSGPVNSEANEVYSSVAADGSLYFTSNRPGSLAQRGSDLYLARRLADGTFGEPANVGPPVNSNDGIGDTFVARDESYLISKAHDYCPTVTPDGKYLFFSRRRSDPPDSGWAGVIEGDVYWVDASVIERLRQNAE